MDPRREPFIIVGRLVSGGGFPPQHQEAKLIYKDGYLLHSVALLHLVPMNLSITYLQKSAKAFKLMFDNIISKNVRDYRTSLPDRSRARPITICSSKYLMPTPVLLSSHIWVYHWAVGCWQMRVGR